MPATADVLATIIRILSPYVGETMARSATQAHCQKLGIDGGEISGDQIEGLIGRLGSGLNFFGGGERAAAVVEELKRATTGPVAR